MMHPCFVYSNESHVDSTEKVSNCFRNTRHKLVLLINCEQLRHPFMYPFPRDAHSTSNYIHFFQSTPFHRFYYDYLRSRLNSISSSSSSLSRFSSTAEYTAPPFSLYFLSCALFIQLPTVRFITSVHLVNGIFLLLLSSLGLYVINLLVHLLSGVRAK